MRKRHVEAFRHGFFSFSFQHQLRGDDFKLVANIMPLLTEFEITSFFSRVNYILTIFFFAS